MVGVCQLRIEPSEMSAPATREGQVARYAEIKARLMGAVVKDAPPPMREVRIRTPTLALYDPSDAHVVLWIRYQIARSAQSAGKKEFVDPSPTVNMIISEAAKFYQVTRNDILSQRRAANVVKPRQVAMYLAKTLTLRSLPEIGRRFGGRDHTTVLHAVRKIDKMLASDRALASEIKSLITLLQWRPA